MILSMAGHIHRPEATVAGDVPEETTIAVSGTDDNARARMAFNGSTVGVTVLVIGAGNEGFYDLHIHLFDAVQLGQLQDPVTL